jgi:hypothetical protein
VPAAGHDPASQPALDAGGLISLRAKGTTGPT